MIEPVSFQIEFGKFNTDIKKISFPPGIHVIYGESGTGKSSFIKKMAGMEIDTIENFKISKLSFPEKFQIVFKIQTIRSLAELYKESWHLLLSAMVLTLIRSGIGSMSINKAFHQRSV